MNKPLIVGKNSTPIGTYPAVCLINPKYSANVGRHCVLVPVLMLNNCGGLVTGFKCQTKANVCLGKSE